MGTAKRELTAYEKKPFEDKVRQLLSQGYSRKDIVSAMEKEYPGVGRIFERVKYTLEKVRSGVDTATVQTLPTATNKKKDVVNEDGSRDVYLQVPEKELNFSKSPVGEILKKNMIAPDEWDVKSISFSEWDALGEDGKIKMNSCKVSLAPKVNAITDKFYLEMAKSLRQNKKDYIKPMNVTGNGMLIVPLADFHLDKPEPFTNPAYPSLKNQEMRFYEIISRVCGFIEKNKESVAKIVFFWSQDFFNYNDPSKCTLKGTAQDSSTSFQNMILLGTQMLVNAINKFESYAPVELFYTRSNHDETAAFHVMNALSMRYLDDENITIDGIDAKTRVKMWNNGEFVFDFSPRAYVRWGDCLFGFAHGDKEQGRLFSIMQVEARKYFALLYAKSHNIKLSDYYDIDSAIDDIRDNNTYFEKNAWDDTTVHEWFCGHFHSKKVEDKSGAIVNNLPSDQSGDVWHSVSGWVGAQRKQEIYLYYKDGDCQTMSFQSRNLLSGKRK